MGRQCCNPCCLGMAVISQQQASMRGAIVGSDAAAGAYVSAWLPAGIVQSSIDARHAEPYMWGIMASGCISTICRGNLHLGAVMICRHVLCQQSAAQPTSLGSLCNESHRMTGFVRQQRTEGVWYNLPA